MKRTSVRMPKDLHERIRRESFETGLSQNEIIVEAIKQKYEEEFNMKKYYLGEEDIDPNQKARIFLELASEDIVEKINIGDTVYAEDVNDIGTYQIEYSPSDESFSVEELEGHTIAWIEEFTSEQLEQIEDGEITDEDEIIEIMKKEGSTIDDLETYLAYEYFDGNNQKEIILEGCFDEGYMDYTEEFEGMKEIEKIQHEVGNFVLYKLKNDYSLLVDHSCYQGAFPEAYLINKYDVNTVKQALKYI